MVNTTKCDSTHQNGSVGSEVDLLLFPKWLFFQLNFGAKKLKSDIVFSRYDKATSSLILRKRLLKFGNLGKLLAYDSNSKVHQILQATWRVSIRDSKIGKISKSTLGPNYSILTFVTHVIQNLGQLCITNLHIVAGQEKPHMCIRPLNMYLL